MVRAITPATSLDSLRKEAKRWLKAVRAGDPDARARLVRSWPDAPPEPGLRDLQHALAREHSCDSWVALKRAVQQVAHRPSPSNTHAPGADLATRFLEYACPDHHVRGRPAHRMARHAAMRLLDEHSEIARDSLYTAVVCGELDEVDRLLHEQPELANTPHAARGRDRSGAGGALDFLQDFGSKPWSPLLYLAFTRLPLAKANDNAVPIARRLLDAGADPNAFFIAGSCHYTPLTGIAGEGEEDRPPHPRRDELARLLLERGGEPYDSQVIYDIHFHGQVLWWLKLMYEFSLERGRAADWADPEWHMLDQGPYGSGARWHLQIAVDHNDLELADWCLAHGANPNAASSRPKAQARGSLYEQAVRLGHADLAELLLRYGAERREIVIDDEGRFVAAALRLDRDEAARLLREHPEFRRSPAAMFAAAKGDRADVVALLLDLGVSIDAEDAKRQRPLHVAAAHDAVSVAELLIARGAEVDPYELNYSNTPLDFAVHFEHARMIDLLVRHSRDVWNLTFVGAVDRLREVLGDDPSRAKVSWQTTPLFGLPEDEQDALDIARMLLAHGADPGFRSRKDGSTAADIARKRGMSRVAELLESAAGPAAEGGRAQYMRDLYEQLARDLVTVNESDDTDALQRLARHFDRLMSYDDVRAIMRRRVDALDDPRGETAGARRLGLENARNLIATRSGFADWAALVASLGPVPSTLSTSTTLTSVDQCERLADDFVRAFNDRDEAALARMNDHYHRSFTFDDLRAEVWRRAYSFRQRASREQKAAHLEPDEARLFVAQDAGFGRWDRLIGALSTGMPPVPAYEIDTKESRIVPRRYLSGDDWDDLIALMKDRRITAVAAHGQMTNRLLARIAELDHVTTLSLAGSRQLTDEGMQHLAHMPQLEHLDVSGVLLTDRGLEVLRDLPHLKTFEMTWQRGVSDAGVANLRFCDRLERVDLMGSPTGDGAIAALQGKPRLRFFSSGRRVTDAGLHLLPNIPMFRTWLDADGPSVDGADYGAHLLIDGPITDAGVATLATLEGVGELDLFWNVTHVTSAAFAHLRHLPNLRSLGADGELTDDAAMRFIALLPRLRKLRCQGTVATDAGFEALSASQTIERIWGRECPNLGSRGFVALSRMPVLASLGVSCRKVDDEALSTLPRFPALRELTPIDVRDDGFRHVGQCRRLERLVCMYCRETTDAATAHLAGLQLTSYYAGLTEITDRSLEILGGMPSLEQVELYECKRLTDAGLPFLAALPRLREVLLDGNPGVTLDGTRVFPPRVRVKYST